jgi:proline iminopeptidase
MPALRKKDLNALREVFRRFPPIREARLFGSRATGSARPTSDIDVAILAPAMTGPQWSRLREALEESDVVFIVDAVWFDRLPPGPLRSGIEQHGVPIYPA